MTQLTLEQCVFTACLWEATARKAGNVHRYRDFENLTYLDFIQSAHAIAPVIANMVDAPIGETVLECIKATRRVVNTNTNLGIVLLLVPLSKLEEYDHVTIDAVLQKSTVADAKHVYEAIRLAVPGGMGEVDSQDISKEPDLTLLEVMRLAADRDTIAKQYVSGYEQILQNCVLIEESLHWREPVELTIIQLQIEFLEQSLDSLLLRKRGPKIATEVRDLAREVKAARGVVTIEGIRVYRQLDEYLRSRGNKLNPGTTADLVTASLFVWLRTNKIDLNRPFTWKEYGG